MGAIGSLGTTRFLRSLLFALTATDPQVFAGAVFAGATALPVFVAVMASWLPAPCGAIRSPR